VASKGDYKEWKKDGLNIKDPNIQKPKTLSEAGLTPHQRVFCYLKSF